MTQYSYRAIDGAGELRTGNIDGVDEASVSRALIDEGLTPIELQSQKKGAGVRQSRFGSKIGIDDQVVLLQELATLLKAGISITEALPSMALAYGEQSLGVPLLKLDSDVKAGRRLTDSLAESGLGLPSYALAILEAGEASGKVAQACADAASQMDHERRVSQEMRNALIYPSILVLAGTLAILIIFVGVVPRFASLLKNPRAEVPALSRWVIESGLFLQQNWLIFGLLASGLIAAVVMALSTPGVRDRVHALAARSPGIGPWIVESETGRWATLLGTLLSNRVPIIKALHLSRSVLRLQLLKQVLGRASLDLERGKALSDVLSKESWFPPTRLNLIRVGERSGELPQMLLTLGQLQTEASRLRQRRILTLIEPLSILLIGTVIGIIMVAVMMAITSLNTVTL